MTQASGKFASVRAVLHLILLPAFGRILDLTLSQNGKGTHPVIASEALNCMVQGEAKQSPHPGRPAKGLLRPLRVLAMTSSSPFAGESQGEDKHLLGTGNDGRSVSTPEKL